MARIAGHIIVILALGLATAAKPVQEVKTAQEIDRIGGFFLYRVLNGRIEYLLLKKAGENDWSPPKGNLEDPESEVDTAIRETREETGFTLEDGDYAAYIQYKVYFEYVTNDDELKKVNLWPAEMVNLEKPVQLSAENEAYAWLDFDAAVTTIKHQYADGLRQGDTIIRAHESSRLNKI